MIFSKKEEVREMTVEECGTCKNMLKRKYHDGDTLFYDASKCRCGQTMQITMIYGESYRP